MIFRGTWIGHSSHSPWLNHRCKIECLQNAPHWQSLKSETALTLLRNLGITLSSKLQLRWLKMIWNAKTKLYNFHVLSFERYRLHQGRNRAWSCCTCTADVLECSFAYNSNTQIWWSLFSEASKSGEQNFQLKNTTFLVILGLCFVFNIFS